MQEYTEGAPSTGTLSRKWTRGPVTQLRGGGGGGGGSNAPIQSWLSPIVS